MILDERVEVSTKPDQKWSAKTREIVRRAERSHARIPVLRKIPLRAIVIILFIAFLNVVVWVAAAILLVGGYT